MSPVVLTRTVTGFPSCVNMSYDVWTVLLQELPLQKIDMRKVGLNAVAQGCCDHGSSFMCFDTGSFVR